MNKWAFAAIRRERPKLLPKLFTTKEMSFKQGYINNITQCMSYGMPFDLTLIVCCYTSSTAEHSNLPGRRPGFWNQRKRPKSNAVVPVTATRKPVSTVLLPRVV